jgi:hypothetical protein
MFGTLPKVTLSRYGPKTNSSQILIAIGGLMQEDAKAEDSIWADLPSYTKSCIYTLNWKSLRYEQG